MHKGTVGELLLNVLCIYWCMEWDCDSHPRKLRLWTAMAMDSYNYVLP